MLGAKGVHHEWCLEAEDAEEAAPRHHVGTTDSPFVLGGFHTFLLLPCQQDLLVMKSIYSSFYEESSLVTLASFTVALPRGQHSSSVTLAPLHRNHQAIVCQLSSQISHNSCLRDTGTVYVFLIPPFASKYAIQPHPDTSTYARGNENASLRKKCCNHKKLPIVSVIC